MKLKLKDYSIIIMLLFSLQNLLAQHTIYGKVVDSQGNAIKGVEVYSASGGILAKSDLQGSYKITSLKSGKHKIVFFSYYFKINEKNIAITNKNLQLNIVLEALEEELSEVVINQRKRKAFTLKRLKEVEGTAIFAGKKTEVVLVDQSIGNKAANNARQIYSQVVGLNIYENDDAGLQLNIGGRGLDPNRTSNFNTRQNGYDISADVLGYPESYYTPPGEALKEIQIIRGAASLQYGTQFGGLLNFKFKGPNRNEGFELITRQSIGSFGLFNSFTSVGGTVGKTGYYGYFNFKEGDGFRPNSAFNSKNIYAHVDHKISNKTTFIAEFTHLNYLAKQPGGLTDSQFNQNPLQSLRSRNWFDIDWNLWALKLEHNFTEATRLSFNLFGLSASRKALGYRGNYKFIGLNPVSAPDETENGVYDFRDLIIGNYKNWGIETRFLSNYTLGNKKSIFLVGAKYYRANNDEKQGAGSRDSDADFKFVDKEDYNSSFFKFPNENVAIFGENIFKISESFTLTPGIRLEYIKTSANGEYSRVLRDGAGNALPGGISTAIENKVKERSFALLGIGVSYKPSASFELYGNISQNYRSVTFNDIRTVNPSFLVGENIGDEKGATADIGLRGRWNNFLSYDVGAYGLFYKDRIGVTLVSTGPNKGDRVRDNIGEAFIYGVESFIDWNLLSVFHSANDEVVLNLFTNIAVTASEYTKSKERSVVGKKVEFIPLMNFKTGVKFGYKNFLGSVQYTHLSKQFTDATNGETVQAGSSREGLVGSIPAYSILDASFSYSYKRWKLETGINNLLNENYFTRRATGYPGPGIIPSAPRSYYVTLEFSL
ncbi:TonB-dependent outer membrane receptor. Putative iron(III) dicitrate-transporter [Tenacibaculum maritimum]|uniref:TonB-dependent receptor domain-containing protein n=1 Tax=Tenacibaculum maritimum TaxID=107401 RepID=UPI0012E666FB|nr:TonB-dependent receptor [Tenacibaculum maritimum]CAA0149810.1 TonB-dependent outer membrane receptor. Putative iron(III) dicitrate-transporter [Tenacibaculum maritimum]CAA0150523.1 TonB-dependent outer membrane receptor. Putative iron(III) dicitrate-transporter [Tenacibaculum maritimum]CAA0196356.1 TonB-dependent outer membrane receptor. Putative iron(III) dicitrate-transporter [Tenacibaculum maritimum]